MVFAHHSTTAKLAQYLKQLLRPLLLRYMNERTFVNEADWIEKLHHYTYKEKHLQPTTLFVTMNITNFHTMASHQSIVTTLVNFLNDHLATNKIHYTSITAPNRYQWISIDTIRKLTELYLKANLFYYAGKIYGFTKGSPNSLFLSELLSNIYLYTYEKLIYIDPRLKTELYGR